MVTISIINLKGGVAKTLTAVNMAHILAAVHNKRVLLVDNDKQGNASKMFGLHSYEEKSVADIMTEKRPNMQEIIAPTQYSSLDLIPANMNLLRANLAVMVDNTRQRETRFKKAVRPKTKFIQKYVSICACTCRFCRLFVTLALCMFLYVRVCCAPNVRQEIESINTI